jgi:hypothetical protein
MQIKKILGILCFGIFFFANAQNNTAQNYSIVIGDLNVPVGRCGVSVEVDGVGKFDAIAVAPQYIVDFSFNSSENINRKIKVKGVLKWGIPPNNAPACQVNGEIFINQLILDEWKPIKDQHSGKPALTCINTGVEYYGEKIDGSVDYNKLYMRVKDARSSKIFETCDKILPIQIRENVSCELNNGAGKSICNEGYYSASQTSGQRLTFNQAIVASLKGEEIKRGAWETKEAELNRNIKTAKQEEERQRIAKERADREKWLESPDGKRYIAEEDAKLKKLQQEQLKAEELKKAEAEKRRAEEKVKDAMIRQQCTKLKSWASDSNELIAKALKTSASSISRIRFEMGKFNCLAVVDTPKGPERCTVMDILQDKKSGEYFADMGGPYGVQAVCGGLAF